MSIDKDALIIQLGEALDKLKEQFDYNGGGDSWERECWEACNGEEEVTAAQNAFEQYQQERANGTVEA
jgi:hypothetical protein